MAVAKAMFIFEVVVSSVQSMVESRFLMIKSDFADIFSLELKDPKQMHITMPEPPPLPPETGKKGKKKKKPKPKKKGKKGKKGKVEAPPPEPLIQSGQSVLFSSTAEFLIQTMKKFPLEVSLWSKEENLTFIGSATIPWDPIFLIYLEKICQGQDPKESIALTEDYNIFEEGKAKMMAKLGMEVKLTHLGDKCTTSFRTLSEDPKVKKCLYTGINSKTTSYICTLKTTDEDFVENSNKIENNFVVDKPKPQGVVYAEYKNAPGANLTFFDDANGTFCCLGHADKPPESIYKSPETCPDIEYITDYVRKIIVSCNDNMRMLTPRPTIRPRIKATDIDRLCYCKEMEWPEGEFAENFKKEAQADPCPVCINAGKHVPGARGAVFDIANIRGPCGRPDCRIARDMREYIENLVEEDAKEIDINSIIGPCGSKECTLAEKIQEFIRHEGVFTEGATVEGLSTQCACTQKLQEALVGKKSSCDTSCSKDCESAESESNFCDGKKCPFKPKVYNVYYFTVEHDFERESSGTSSSPPTDTTDATGSRYCSADCPSAKLSARNLPCSENTCGPAPEKESEVCDPICSPICPSQNARFPPSPADSDIVMKFSDIHNPCCVKTCDVAEVVKDFLVDGVEKAKKKKSTHDECYCDCVCTFKLGAKTTYCGVCGGYECLGDDMKNEPEYAKPMPCPVYHKMYDRSRIITKSPWPEEKKPPDDTSNKSTKTGGSKQDRAERKSISGGARTSNRMSKLSEKKQPPKKVKPKPQAKEKKQVGKFTANVEEEPRASVEKKPEPKYPYPQVPRNMGWNWNADDIPGLKPRPNWKPGAANKLLVRRYRAVREGGDNIAKKKRALMQKKKKYEWKPFLTVKKINGEFTVQMEVFRTFSKERLLGQYPYDEKPPLIYTIGKTEEEKQKLQRQKDRRERRESRRKSKLLQSTFRDKCQEICLKAYNQAIGLLPLPNANDPECPCYTEPPGNMSPPVIDSCSCSDGDTISSSDTDGDEWEIQFSPPAALFDSKAKSPPLLVENESQYCYLDYKVKILDKQGNQVPRYFKGPDGKQLCSDLGGFFNANHVWQEINKDGYIGPDNRWVPSNFVGPDGMFYSSDDGQFIDANGTVSIIGVDGYIDKDGKWAWYPKSQRTKAKSAKSTETTDRNKKDKPHQSSSPVPTIGKVDPGKTSPTSSAKEKKQTSKSPDKLKASASKASKPRSPIIVSVSMHNTKYNNNKGALSPNAKLRVDPKKMAKYTEIIQSFQQYDDLQETMPLLRSTRASNTTGKKDSSHRGDLTSAASKAKHKRGTVSTTGINSKSKKGLNHEDRLAKGTGEIMTGFMPSARDKYLHSKMKLCLPKADDCRSELDCQRAVDCDPSTAVCPTRPCEQVGKR